MITKIWHGKTKTEHSDEYLNYIEEIGIKNYKAIEGNISAKILRRIDDKICHFLTVTEWDSFESIIKFADKDYKKTRYYPEDKQYHLNFEENVIHYDHMNTKKY